MTALHAWIEEQLKLAMRAAVAQTTEACDLKMARFTEQHQRQQDEIEAKFKLIREELAKFEARK